MQLLARNFKFKIASLFFISFTLSSTFFIPYPFFPVCFKIFDADRDGLLNSTELLLMMQCLVEVRDQGRKEGRKEKRRYSFEPILKAA